MMTNNIATYLQALEVLETLLNQFLDLAGVPLGHILPECISRPSLRILAEVVGGELLALP